MRRLTEQGTDLHIHAQTFLLIDSPQMNCFLHSWKSFWAPGLPVLDQCSRRGSFKLCGAFIVILEIIWAFTNTQRSFEFGYNAPKCPINHQVQTSLSQRVFRLLPVSTVIPWHYLGLYTHTHTHNVRSSSIFYLVLCESSLHSFLVQASLSDILLTHHTIKTQTAHGDVVVVSPVNKIKLYYSIRRLENTDSASSL